MLDCKWPESDVIHTIIRLMQSNMNHEGPRHSNYNAYRALSASIYVLGPNTTERLFLILKLALLLELLGSEHTIVAPIVLHFNPGKLS